MAEALQHLDDLSAPGAIGSELASAFARLGEWLAIEKPPPVSIETLVAPQAAGGSATEVEVEENEPLEIDPI